MTTEKHREIRKKPSSTQGPYEPYSNTKLLFNDVPISDTKTKYFLFTACC
jgi:hypothetical protein